MTTSEGIHEHVVAPDVISAFVECARLTEIIDAHYHSSFEEFQRSEIVTFIGEKLLERRVWITELQPPQRERPIKRYTPKDNVKLKNLDKQQQEELRSFEGASCKYTTHKFWLYRGSSHGKAISIDAQTASLVVRPRGFVSYFQGLDWIKVAGPDGQPLVRMMVID